MSLCVKHSVYLANSTSISRWDTLRYNFWVESEYFVSREDVTVLYESGELHFAFERKCALKRKLSWKYQEPASGSTLLLAAPFL